MFCHWISSHTIAEYETSKRRIILVGSCNFNNYADDTVLVDGNVNDAQTTTEYYTKGECKLVTVLEY